MNNFPKVTFSSLSLWICLLAAGFLFWIVSVWLTFRGGHFGTDGLLSCRQLCCPVSFRVNCLKPECHFHLLGFSWIVLWCVGTRREYKGRNFCRHFTLSTKDKIVLNLMALYLSTKGEYVVVLDLSGTLRVFLRLERSEFEQCGLKCHKLSPFWRVIRENPHGTPFQGRCSPGYASSFRLEGA